MGDSAGVNLVVQFQDGKLLFYFIWGLIETVVRFLAFREEGIIFEASSFHHHIDLSISVLATYIYSPPF